MEQSTVHEQRMLIGGALVDAQSQRTSANVDPTTEQVLGVVADGGPEDADRALQAARDAFDTTSWATDRELRKRCLQQLQDAIEGEREDLRAELVAEAGVPLALTYGPQLDMPLADSLRYPLELIDSFAWERDLPRAAPFGVDSLRAVWKEPVGVVAAIVPWNFPFEVTIGKLGQALATGNTVVLKPAPDTPFNATRLGRLVAEKTDIPPGVLNVLTTSDNGVAEQLTLDPRVDMVSFTGSTAVGKRIMANAAQTLKRVFLELGGKSAAVFLDDADLAATLPGAAFGICMHAGQGCALQSRVLVPRGRYAEAVEVLTATMATMPYGDPRDPGVFQGPQISELQRRRVLGMVEQAVADGASVALGGGRPAHLPTGWFVEPTLLVDVDNSMRIAQEEVFGPVLVVIPHDGDDDAVRIANDSPYGLSGGVFSGSTERATAFARRVRTGSISVNGGLWYGADSPYGGYKSSGTGRQNGLEGFEQHLETKAVGWAAPPS